MNNQADIEKLAGLFKTFIGNQELVYQLLDLNPIPILMLAPDGTLVFCNRAFLEFNNVPDAELLVGKYNFKNDPVCIAIIGQERIDRTLRGEAGSYSDFPVPIQDLIDRGVVDEKPFEAATVDMFSLPIWDGDIFVCAVVFFTVKNMYQGRADIIAVQEYIKQNWLDDFDTDKIAQSVNLSKRHFQRIFKEVTGDTPMEYYRNVKIEKIQEKLLDDSLSIEQVFAACGVGAHGTYSNLFKEKTKMSPSEYRKKMMK
jgi:AraC-like DNA-binding protein